MQTYEQNCIYACVNYYNFVFHFTCIFENIHSFKHIHSFIQLYLSPGGNLKAHYSSLHKQSTLHNQHYTAHIVKKLKPEKSLTPIKIQVHKLHGPRDDDI